MESSEPHFQSLRNRHQQLEKAITEEQKRRAPDSIKLHDLKREKLHIKEQLEGIVRR